MPKISSEHKEKILAGKKANEAKHMFDLCGWEVWIDPLNYQIRRDGKSYYWSTFLGMLKGLKAHLDIRSARNADGLEDMIIRIENNNEKISKELKALLDSYTSLGELEWH